jgi:DMSO/TMAO reductase YedYZ molybdopterin-dependent catalytic subunit
VPSGSPSSQSDLEAHSDQRERAIERTPAAGLTRRRLLATVAASSVLAACERVAVSSRFLAGMGRWNERVDRFLFAPERLAPELALADATPATAFPSYFISDSMPFAPADWVLKVGGLVARPATFSLNQLQRMTRTETRVRHHCVEGWSAVAAWHGVRLREIAEAVGADPRARYVEFRSFDAGYWSSWDRDSALHKQTILAYGMNGEPLGPDHGAPLRLYSGVKLGYKMVKYLTEVNFLPERSGGYWEDQGYEWFGGV